MTCPTNIKVNNGNRKNMKTNILLLFISICYTITASCQPPKKEQIILDFKNQHGRSQIICDSIGSIIEEQYFKGSITVDQLLKTLTSRLKEYNDTLFYTLGNHRNNLCYELDKKILAYEFSKFISYTPNNYDLLINILTTSDSILKLNYIAFPELISYINRQIKQNEIKTLLLNINSIQGISEYSLNAYILNCYYSLSEENLLFFLENIIPSLRYKKSYFHIIFHLIHNISNLKYKDLLQKEKFWMNDHPEFINSERGFLYDSTQAILKKD